MYKIPVKDMLSGFCFEKSGFHSENVYISYFVQPLHLGSDHIVLSYGKRLKGKNGELWHLKNNPVIEETIFELTTFMNKAIYEFLDKVDTPQKFYRFYENNPGNVRRAQALTYTAIYLGQDDYKSVLENYITILQNENFEISWIQKLYEEAKYLISIIDDKEAIHNFFQKNIIHTKEALKL